MKSLAALLLGMYACAQTRVNPDALIVQDFQTKVTAYVTLQKKLAKDLPPMKPTDEPAKISDHQHQLASKIREARRGARQGAIFTPDIAKEFHRLLEFAHQGEDDARIRKSLERAEPVYMTLHVNDAYPPHIPLQSTPPTILANLPRLPPELEYRIVGKTLILRDTTANIVVDLIPDALP